ncbi:MAG: hypothetical protein ACK41E_02950 [Deinococcales bacterium]
MKLLLWLLSGLLLCNLVLAQGLPQGTEAQVGQHYSAGTRVNISQHGLSFIVPNGFSGTTIQSSGGRFTILARGQDTNVVVWAFTGISKQDAALWLAYPIEISENLKFTLLDNPVVQNELVYAYHTSPQLESLTVLRFGNDSAIGFTIITSKVTSQELPSIGNSLVSNSVFAPSPLAESVRQVRQGLGGLYLLHYSFKSAGTSGFGGTESQRRWDFCSDGRYAYFGRVESSYTTNNPYAATSFSLFNTSGASEVGTWRLFALGDTFSILTISSQGVLDVHTLSNLEQANNKLPFLNGKELGAYGRSNLCQ